MPIAPATAAATRTALTCEPPLFPPPSDHTVYRLDASPLTPKRPPASSLTLSQCNRRVPEGAIRAMITLRNTMEEGCSYNTLQDLFTVCDRARILQRQAHPTPFAAAWSMGPPVAPSPVQAGSVEPFPGGTCLASAPYLQQRISQQLHFKCYVVGTHGGMNLLTKWPGLTHEQSDENLEALGRLGGINHTDVVVPIRLNKQAPLRLLHIQCGLGPSPHHWQLLQMPHDRDKIDALFLLSDVAALRWQSLAGCLTHYVSDPARNISFGVNLLSGDVFVSHRAAETMPGAMQGRSFHFADLIRQEALAAFEGEAEQLEVAEGWSKARQYVATVAQGFAQAPTFTDHILFVMRHRDALLKELLLAPALTLSECQKAREEAMAVRQPVEALLTLWQIDLFSEPLTEARGHLRAAADHVRANLVFRAEFAYTNAAKAYIKAVEDVAPAIRAWCRTQAEHLKQLPREAVGLIPKALFMAVATGLVQGDASHRAYHRVTRGILAVGRPRIEQALGITGEH